MAKTVLVTGSNRGIGLALAKKYQQDGWNVIAGARNVADADALKQLGVSKLVQIDTSDEASILRVAEELKGTPIDLLINNAGIIRPASLESETKANIIAQFEVNTVGPFLVTRALRANLKSAAEANGSATVAQISSYVGSISENKFVEGSPIPAGGIYGYRASKSALNQINKSLAHDLKPDGIIAVTLHPGYVATDATGHDPRAISTEESANGVAKVISGVTAEDTGRFISYDGNPLPW